MIAKIEHLPCSYVLDSDQTSMGVLRANMYPCLISRASVGRLRIWNGTRGFQNVSRKH